MIFVHQIHGASAEAATCHAAPDKARQSLRGFDHYIQLAATDLIEIAQADVGLVHQFAHAMQIAFP